MIFDRPPDRWPVSQEGLPIGSPGSFDKRLLGALIVENAKRVVVHDADEKSIMHGINNIMRAASH